MNEYNVQMSCDLPLHKGQMVHYFHVCIALAQRAYKIRNTSFDPSKIPNRNSTLLRYRKIAAEKYPFLNDNAYPQFQIHHKQAARVMARNWELFKTKKGYVSHPFVSPTYNRSLICMNFSLIDRYASVKDMSKERQRIEAKFGNTEISKEAIWGDDQENEQQHADEEKYQQLDMSMDTPMAMAATSNMDPMSASSRRTLPLSIIQKLANERESRERQERLQVAHETIKSPTEGENTWDRLGDRLAGPEFKLHAPPHVQAQQDAAAGAAPPEVAAAAATAMAQAGLIASVAATTPSGTNQGGFPSTPIAALPSTPASMAAPLIHPDSKGNRPMPSSGGTFVSTTPMAGATPIAASPMASPPSTAMPSAPIANATKQKSDADADPKPPASDDKCIIA
jgi:hypothetical protein